MRQAVTHWARRVGLGGQCWNLRMLRLGFLDLPRELRDAIYAAVIRWERRQPCLEDAQLTLASAWRVVREADSVQRGEYGCAYSTKPVPSTCANVLVCNRQIHEEMRQAIARARRSGHLAARLDCIASDESLHAFSWRSMPVVKTMGGAPKGTVRGVVEWAGRLVGRYIKQGSYGGGGGCITTIEHLWIDIRLFGSRSAKWDVNQGGPERTSWAICAALKHVFEQDGLLSPARGAGSEVAVDELTLNVMSPDGQSQEYIAEDFPLDAMSEGIVHPHTVARELVEVWHKIWQGDEFKGIYHGILLRRIRRVRVCVDGATWRVRELKRELERGQAEQRRIAARGIW